ncbi:MAG: class I SAM-dependent methyltransferase, partial [Chloroflexi bacterium]|nr:class I SAM-dependent methyltransferase [Chloroflexota bacterium]
VSFLQADLSDPHWADGLTPASYDFVLAFAVLHHLPGRELRLKVLRAVRGLLAPGGQLVHSEWQFTHSPRLAARVLPWETVGLRQVDVDEGDALLDWRRQADGSAQGAPGIRYAHQYGEAELAGLAAETGFTIQETFYSDGDGGDLGLYQVWE